MILPEGTDHLRIPGKPVEGEGDSVFHKQIAHILEKDVQMAGEEAVLRAGGLYQELPQGSQISEFIPNTRIGSYPSKAKEEP